jgi:imidazole glycerol-phosphate synthase subunit HisF
MRIIPCLQLLEDSLVKTTKFESPRYIGDPVNTVRIFNELEVDELCFLDIRATLQQREPYYSLLQQIADECFMPLSYGGGITSIEQAKKIFRAGFEKIIVGSAAFQNPGLIKQLAAHYGSQAVIAAIDVKKNWLGNYTVMSHSATKKTGREPVEWAQEMAQSGAGEILLTSVDNEGTWNGFDVALVKKVSEAVNIPVIAHGGAGNEEHIRQVSQSTQAGAVAAGSFFVYQKKDMGVLINFPKEKIEAALTLNPSM